MTHTVHPVAGTTVGDVPDDQAAAQGAAPSRVAVDSALQGAVATTRSSAGLSLTPSQVAPCPFANCSL